MELFLAVIINVILLGSFGLHMVPKVVKICVKAAKMVPKGSQMKPNGCQMGAKIMKNTPNGGPSSNIYGSVWKPS